MDDDAGGRLGDGQRLRGLRRLDEYRGRRRIYHGGSTRGFRNNLQWFPDENLTVVFLSNRNELSGEMLDEIVDLLLEPSP